MRCAYPPYRTGPAVGWIRRAARCQGPGTPVVRAASTKGLRDAAQIWNCWAVERAGEVDANQADAPPAHSVRCRLKARVSPSTCRGLRDPVLRPRGLKRSRLETLSCCMHINFRTG